MAFVNIGSNLNEGAPTVTTCQVTSFAMVAGNAYAGFVHQYNNVDRTTTMTDSLGNTWTIDAGASVFNGTDQWAARCFRCIATNSGTATVTATASDTCFSIGLAVAGYDSVSSFLDSVTQRQASPGTGTDAISSSIIDITSQPARQVAFSICYSGPNDPNTGTGFTSRGADLWGGFGRLQDRQVTTIGNSSGTFTSVGGQGGSTYYTSQIVFLESGGGGGSAIAAISNTRRMLMNNN
jgi:hypothetical protein